jgi:dihydroflavonol-4-reductase
MQKALVTGAAGFIGSNVVRVLLEDGMDVRAMVLRGEDERNLDGLDIEKVPGDVLDVASLEAALKGCDTLFHLAAIYAIWARDRGIFYRVNLQGTRNMLWAAMRADLEKVVFTSSIAGLGVAPGKQLSDETTEFNQWGQGDYIITKHLSQQEALTFAREGGLPLVVVNPCFPYGEGDVAPTPTGKIILDTANGMQLMTFAGGVNMVDVEDVAKGHLLAAKRGRVGEMYILGNENVTIRELLEMVARAAGLQIRFITVPVTVAKVAGLLFVKLADITGKPPVTTAKEVAYSAQHLFYDVSKAKRELGYDPMPVEQSVERALEWYRREGFIPRKGPLPAVLKTVGKALDSIPIGK